MRKLIFVTLADAWRPLRLVFLLLLLLLVLTLFLGNSVVLFSRRAPSCLMRGLSAGSRPRLTHASGALRLLRWLH